MQAVRLIRRNGEGNILMFPEWGRIVETLLLREDGMRLENKRNSKHQGVFLGDVMALINNGNAVLTCNLTAICSNETTSRTKKICISQDIRKMVVLLDSHVSRN